jgi:hypothetical protein
MPVRFWVSQETLCALKLGMEPNCRVWPTPAGVYPFDMQYYQRGNTSAVVLWWWDFLHLSSCLNCNHTTDVEAVLKLLATCRAYARHVLCVLLAAGTGMVQILTRLPIPVLLTGAGTCWARVNFCNVSTHVSRIYVLDTTMCQWLPHHAPHLNCHSWPPCSGWRGLPRCAKVCVLCGCAAAVTPTAAVEARFAFNVQQRCPILNSRLC